MNSKKLYREMGVLLVVVIGAGFIIPPRIAVVYNNRGARLYQLGELPAAVAAYKISLRWQSASVVHYNLACVYEKLGSIREAITEFALAVKLDPRYSDAVEALIDLSRRSGDLPQAEAYLREFQQAGGTALDRYAGILRKDRERQLWRGAAQSYNSGDIAQAETRFKEILALDPHCAQAYAAMGDLVFKQGRLNDAQAWYQQSIAEGNASAGVYNNLGIIAMQQEDYGRAVEYLRKAHAAAPDNINITYSLASTLRDNREFDEALLLYKQVIADNPGYPNIHNDLGGIYEIMGRPQAAEREFQMECDSIPAIAAGDNRDPDAVVRLARAYNGLGECEQALAMLSALIEVLPRYREAYYARADVQTKLGDIAAAHEDLETVRNLINHPETANVPGASVPAAAIDPEAGQSSGFFNDIEVALKNGRTLRGRLKKETQTTMTLEMRVGDSFGTITFQKHAVKSVKKLQ